MPRVCGKEQRFTAMRHKEQNVSNLSWVIVEQLYTFTKIHWLVYLQHVGFGTCKLYFTKAILKMFYALFPKHTLCSLRKCQAPWDLIASLVWL